jgi:hypothetical protein
MRRLLFCSFHLRIHFGQPESEHQKITPFNRENKHEKKHWNKIRKKIKKEETNKERKKERKKARSVPGRLLPWKELTLGLLAGLWDPSTSPPNPLVMAPRLLLFKVLLLAPFESARAKVVSAHCLWKTLPHSPHVAILLNSKLNRIWSDWQSSQ